MTTNDIINLLEIITIIVIPSIIIFVLTLIFIRTRKTKYFKDNTSLIILTEHAINSAKLTKEELSNIPEFPSNLTKLIKKHTSLSLSQLLKEVIINTNCDEEIRKEISRALTVASVLYRAKIPAELVYIDKRTRLLYIAILERLELIHVPIVKETDIVEEQQKELFNEMQKYSKEQLAKYAEQLVRIGSVLINYSIENNFPSCEIFVLTARKVCGKYIALDNNDVKSIATAYAALARIKIPRSYTHVSALSIALMNRKDKLQQPKLTIVSS